MEEKALIHSYMDPDSIDVGFHCILGPDQGKFFPLQGNRIVVGRGKNADLRVSDINCSREHFEIVKINSEFILSDLNSQNGTMVNDKKVKQLKLISKDKIAFGSTVLSFYLADNFLDREQLRIAEFKNPESFEKKKSNQQKASISAIVLILVCSLVFLMLAEDEEGAVSDSPKVNERTDVASDLREVNAGLRQNSKRAEKLADIEQEKNVKIILGRGLREMREKNYFRAISEFNHALEINPGHPKASFYLNKANDELNSIIEQYNLFAARDLQSLQYRKALVSYCAILRLLHNFPDSPQFKDTKKKLADISKILEIDDSENSCH